MESEAPLILPACSVHTPWLIKVVGSSTEGIAAALLAVLTSPRGISSYSDQFQPQLVATNNVLNGRTPAAISAGLLDCFAMGTDGTAVAWGSGNSGLFGSGNALGSSSPVVLNPSVLPAGGQFMTITSGDQAIHTLALIAYPGTSLPTATGAGSGPGGSLLAAMAATYGGPVQMADSGSDGTFSATVQPSGAFTAQVTLDGARNPVTGVFDSSGTALANGSTFTLTRPGQSPLALTLTRSGGEVTGTLSDATSSVVARITAGLG